MNGDDLLKLSARALRERYDGESKAAPLARQRLLVAAAQRKRNRALKVAVYLPIAAVFVATTAWAGFSGRLAGTVQLLSHFVLRESALPSPAIPLQHAENTANLAAPDLPSPEATSVIEAPIPTAQPAEFPSASQPAIASVGPRPQPASHPRAPHVASRSSAMLATTSAAADPGSLPTAVASGTPAPSSEPAPLDTAQVEYLRAHDLHFKQRDYGAALVAWDRYLAHAPSGRFAPEARWNRAIALFKLGRPDEAVAELKPFADGAYGDYRRAEATRLIEAASKLR